MGGDEGGGGAALGGIAEQGADGSPITTRR